MRSSENSVSDQDLPERQRAFVEKLRSHDKRVKVYREGAGLKFHGPVIGDGPLPPAEPAVADPDATDLDS